MDWGHHRPAPRRLLLSIRWIGKVWESSPYQGDQLLLHLALADFANDEGECWPSQRTLARKARCSQRWVRESLNRMVEDGRLEVMTQTLGRGGRTLYRLKGEATSSLDAKGGTTEQVKRNSGALDSTNKNRQEPSLSDASFELFWAEYPRKVAKGAARKAWAMLVRRADAPTIEEILRSIRLYRLSVSDPKFICHAATWLRQERWSDELSSTQPETKPSSSPYRQAESLAAGLRHAGRSREDVEAALSGRNPEELAAALAIYDAL